MKNNVDLIHVKRCTKYISFDLLKMVFYINVDFEYVRSYIKRSKI